MAVLWMETQNVQPDRFDHYTVMLGSTSNTGLPANIFVAGRSSLARCAGRRGSRAAARAVGERAICTEGRRCADLGGTARFGLRAGRAAARYEDNGIDARGVDYSRLTAVLIIP
jgi:hypothetical protein